MERWQDGGKDKSSSSSVECSKNTEGVAREQENWSCILCPCQEADCRTCRSICKAYIEIHTTTCWEDKGQVKLLEAGKFGFAHTEPQRHSHNSTTRNRTRTTTGTTMKTRTAYWFGTKRPSKKSDSIHFKGIIPSMWSPTWWFLLFSFLNSWVLTWLHATLTLQYCLEGPWTPTMRHDLSSIQSLVLSGGSGCHRCTEVCTAIKHSLFTLPKKSTNRRRLDNSCSEG